MRAAERERADRAIRAFDSQAKLETMAEANATQVSHRRPWWRRSPSVATALFAAIIFVATGFTTVVLLDRASNQGAMDPLWPSGRIAHIVNVVIADAISARDMALRIGLATDNEDERGERLAPATRARAQQQPSPATLPLDLNQRARD